MDIHGGSGAVSGWGALVVWREEAAGLATASGVAPVGVFFRQFRKVFIEECLLYLFLAQRCCHV